MAHFNSEQLLIRCGNKRELVLKLINIVLLDIPKQLENLDLAVNQGNIEGMWKIAHKIKGTSLNVEFPVLKEIAASIEKIGKSAQAITPELNSLIEDLKKEWDVIQPLLSSF
jgi:HPt (histidine-containing phosphotransfer) domain-containing protein